MYHSDLAAVSPHDRQQGLLEGRLSCKACRERLHLPIPTRGDGGVRIEPGKGKREEHRTTATATAAATATSTRDCQQRKWPQNKTDHRETPDVAAEIDDLVLGRSGTRGDRRHDRVEASG